MNYVREKGRSARGVSTQILCQAYNWTILLNISVNKLCIYTRLGHSWTQVGSIRGPGRVTGQPVSEICFENRGSAHVRMVCG